MILFADEERIFFLDYKNKSYEIVPDADKQRINILYCGDVIRTITDADAVCGLHDIVNGGSMTFDGEKIGSADLCRILSAVIGDGRPEQTFGEAVRAVHKREERLRQRMTNAKNAKKINIFRDSVCMGDDCHAPHASEIEYCGGTTLSELMRSVIDYLPETSGEWEVMDGARALARIIPTERAQTNSAADTRRREGKYTASLAVADARVDDMGIKEIFCRYIV